MRRPCPKPWASPFGIALVIAEEARAMPKPRSTSRQRGHMLHTRLNDDEYAMYLPQLSAYRQSAEARVYGESPGGFLRWLMFGKEARPLRKRTAPKPFAHPSERQLLLLRNDFAGALNNLNQMARGFNRHQLPVPSDQHRLMRTLQDLAAQAKTLLHPPLADEDTPDDRQGPEQS
jgi:hypothetical protein